MDKVRNWWASFSFRGSLSFILAKKLRALKGEIKRWNVEVFGNVGSRNKAWVEELELLDRSEEERGLSEEEKERFIRGLSEEEERGLSEVYQRFIQPLSSNIA